MSLLLSTGAFASSLSGSAPGMVLMKPTSITHSGTSATLGANGQVTFSAVTSLSLNGCFTADFDNYVISARHVSSASVPTISFRLRAAGSDASGSTDYTIQQINVDNTTIYSDRISTNSWRAFYSSSTQRSGHDIHLYGPALAQPTATRTISAFGYLNAYIDDLAQTHSLSTAYDGFTFLVGSGNFTGALQVYGLRS